MFGNIKLDLTLFPCIVNQSAFYIFCESWFVIYTYNLDKILPELSADFCWHHLCDTYFHPIFVSFPFFFCMSSFLACSRLFAVMRGTNWLCTTEITKATPSNNLIQFSYITTILVVSGRIFLSCKVIPWFSHHFIKIAYEIVLKIWMIFFYC